MYGEQYSAMGVHQYDVPDISFRLPWQRTSTVTKLRRSILQLNHSRLPDQATISSDVTRYFTLASLPDVSSLQTDVLQ